MPKEIDMSVRDVIDLDAALMQYIKDCKNNQMETNTNKNEGGTTQ